MVCPWVIEFPPSGQPVPLTPMYRWNSQNCGSVSPMNRVFEVPSVTSATRMVRAACRCAGVEPAATRANIPGNSAGPVTLVPQDRLGPYPGWVGGTSAGGIVAPDGATWPLQWSWNGAGQPAGGLLHCGPTLAT